MGESKPEVPPGMDADALLLRHAQLMDPASDAPSPVPMRLHETLQADGGLAHGESIRLLPDRGSVLVHIDEDEEPEQSPQSPSVSVNMGHGYSGVVFQASPGLFQASASPSVSVSSPCSSLRVDKKPEKKYSDTCAKAPLERYDILGYTDDSNSSKPYIAFYL